MMFYRTHPHNGTLFPPFMVPEEPFKGSANLPEQQKTWNKGWMDRWVGGREGGTQLRDDRICKITRMRTPSTVSEAL